jgi:hypothetical protein
MGAVLTAELEVPRLSLFAAGKQEAKKHRWLESEKAGRDLGDAPERQWVKKHWWSFLRYNWINHIQGVCQCSELHPNDFGLLLRRRFQAQHLLQPILDRLKQNQENLDIIQWVLSENILMADVLEILEALDINRVRLSPDFIPEV